MDEVFKSNNTWANRHHVLPRSLSYLQNILPWTHPPGMVSCHTKPVRRSAPRSTRLTQAVRKQNSQTLEDLVREIPQPRLASWLDDNLPGLVERMVRTEIERIAREH